MTAALVILGVLLTAQFFQHARAERAWEHERQTLLERIQAPERVRFLEPRPEEKEPLELDDPELARVGTIDYGAPDA